MPCTHSRHIPWTIKVVNILFHVLRFNTCMPTIFSGFWVTFACLHFFLETHNCIHLTYLNIMYIKSKGDPRNATGRKEVEEKMRKLQMEEGRGRMGWDGGREEVTWKA